MIKDIERELALVLVEKVGGNWKRLTYKDVANELSQRLGRKIDPHFGLTRPLETIARICSCLNLPLITVRVVRAGSAASQMTGVGFFKIAHELKPVYRSWIEADAWENENRLVRECQDWGKLKDYVTDPRRQAIR